MEPSRYWIELAARAIETLAVTIMVVFMLIGTAKFLFHSIGKEEAHMDGALTRIVGDLIGRLDGPLHFRMFLQTLMACIIAVVDGRRDAQKGRTAYFWALFSEPEHRKALLQRSWKSVRKIFILALVLDVAYQARVLKTFYPGEAFLTAFLLAVVPYVLLRGPVNRLMSRKWIGEKS